MDRDLWLRANEPVLEIFKDTLQPHRAVNRCPVVFTDLDQFNALFKSLQNVDPQWQSRAVWQMYILPHKSKIRLDYTNPDGREIMAFECFPYVDLLGRKFAVRDYTQRAHGLLQKITQGSELSDPVLRLWRIWRKAGPAALSRYPLQLQAKNCYETGRNLLRPRYYEIMVQRFYGDQTFQISGCGIRCSVHSKKTPFWQSGIPSEGTGICPNEHPPWYWTKLLCELVHYPGLREMVYQGTQYPRYSPGGYYPG